MMMKGIGKLAQDLQQQVRDDDYSADINSEDYTLSIHMNGLTGDNAASMDRTKVRIIKSAGPSHTSWVALTHGSISGSVR